jgi:uncharacterized membrane protein
MVALQCGLCREAKRDPVSGRVRVIYIGDVLGFTPYYEIAADPFFSATPVPACMKHVWLNDITRFMRIYMPRTFEQLVELYDLVVLSDTARDLYQPFRLEWFRMGVEQGGQGLLMVGGVESFGAEGYVSWGSSPVGSVLPVQCSEGLALRSDFRAVPQDPDHPFVRSLPFATMPPFHGLNVVTSRPGSELLFETDIVPHHPVLVCWDYGNGSGVAHTPDWTPAWGASVCIWDYYPDYVANLLLLTSGIPVPQDLESRHVVKLRLRDYATGKALFSALLDFVEKFGGDTHDLEVELRDLEKTSREAEALYLQLDFTGALSKLGEVNEGFELLSRKAVKLRERALAWVYLVEYLSVTGTSMAAGFCLWTLMIRRAVYREAGATRAPARRRAF